MPRIGYVALSESFSHPGDYRRFAGYASARGLEIEHARFERKYDLVVVTEGADITLWRDYPHGKVVYDFIDSYLAIPRTSVTGLLRGVAKFVSRQHRRLDFSYWESARRMCRRADAVVCTTESQKSMIEPYCRNVHIVLDSHGSVVRQVKEDYRAGSPFRLVWEGLPSNIEQIAAIRNVLRRLAERHPIELVLVTDEVGTRFLGRFGRFSSAKLAGSIFAGARLHAWNKETTAKLITACDVAVIPIDLGNPLVAGKPENKLLLLWRMGMPVVVSATRAYERAMRDAGIPLACRTDAEWLAALERLIGDEAVRREAGQRGLAFALDQHGEARTLERWDAVLRSIGIAVPPGVGAGVASGAGAGSP